MSSLKELEQRVTVLENRMDVESGLRAGADRDLADMAQTLRAQQRTIQALATTQSEHTALLQQHTVILDQHTAKLDEHGEKLDRHEASLTAAHGKLDLIITMLDHLTP